MKKQTAFKMADGRQLMLCLTIRGMMALEQEIGRSLFSVVEEMSRGSLRWLDLRYTIAALRWALPRLQEEDAVIQLIEEHCAAGGTIDDINQALIETMLATGVFTRGKNDEAAAEDVKAKKK